MNRRSWMLGVVVALCGAMAACSGDISQEAFDQINVGMTLTEVRNVIGSDGEDQTASGTSISQAGIMENKGSRLEMWVWTTTDRKSEIAVEFRDGKVVSKTKRGF